MTTWQTKLSIPEPQEVNNTLLARRDSTATPGQVWAVIADGWTYSQWVVGNSRMRAVDADWPAPAMNLEQLEEVTADLAGRLVVARQVVPRHDRSAKRHEAALRKSTLGQLGRQRAVVGLGQLAEPGGECVER